MIPPKHLIPIIVCLATSATPTIAQVIDDCATRPAPIQGKIPCAPPLGRFNTSKKPSILHPTKDAP